MFKRKTLLLASTQQYKKPSLTATKLVAFTWVSLVGKTLSNGLCLNIFFRKLARFLHEEAVVDVGNVVGAAHFGNNARALLWLWLALNWFILG